jgi:hypothetical protein
MIIITPDTSFSERLRRAAAALREAAAYQGMVPHEHINYDASSLEDISMEVESIEHDQQMDLQELLDLAQRFEGMELAKAIRAAGYHK